MTREFIEIPEFMKRWSELGLDEDDLSELELYLCGNPEAGDVIQGTGGLRKIRWKLRDKGKRGGIRVLYVDVLIEERIFLISAYNKNEKDDIFASEKREIKKLVDILKMEGRVDS